MAAGRPLERPASLSVRAHHLAAVCVFNQKHQFASESRRKCRLQRKPSAQLQPAGQPARQAGSRAGQASASSAYRSPGHLNGPTRAGLRVSPRRSHGSSNRSVLQQACRESSLLFARLIIANLSYLCAKPSLLRPPLPAAVGQPTQTGRGGGCGGNNGSPDSHASRQRAACLCLSRRAAFPIAALSQAEHHLPPPTNSNARPPTNQPERNGTTQRAAR